VTEDAQYRLLKLLERNPEATQREIARELGVSLGKVNYCLRALVDKGLLKAKNFKNSSNKRAYVYVLTPQGIEAKAKISVRFLQRKIAEYEALRLEIDTLRAELSDLSGRLSS